MIRRIHRFFFRAGFWFVVFWVPVACHWSGGHRSGHFSMAFWQQRLDSAARVWSPDARDHVLELRLDSAGENKVVLYGRTDLSGIMDSVRRLLPGDWQVTDSIRLLPDKRFRNRWGVIRLSVANVRVSPAHRSELATQLLAGMPVRIWEYEEGFYRVRTPSGYLGWLDRESLVLMDSVAAKQWFAAPKLIMMESCGWMYDSLTPGSHHVSDLVKNDVLRLIRQTGDFYEVALPDGRSGYVPESAMQTLEEWEQMNRRFASPRDVVMEARREYPGIPYLWGGTSMKALDCSGFTKNVYQSFGFLLPRDASQQYKALKPVGFSEKLEGLEAGDLLFFGKNTPGGKKITHVALYMGGGRIIHATGRVKIESLLPSDSLYNEDRRISLMGAGRVFGRFHRRIYPYYTSEALKIFMTD